MDKYIDLVICDVERNGRLGKSQEIKVCQAPAWSGLERGDEVIIGREHEEARGVVKRLYTIENGGAELEFILVASGHVPPLYKILKKVLYKEFEYQEAEE